jgi:hypothetical protein
MMTGTAIAVSHNPLYHPFIDTSRKVSILDEWKKLLDDTKWENIIKLGIDEAKKSVDRLIEFIGMYEDHFIIDARPVSEDSIEDHLKPHYTLLNRLVHDRVINSRNAVKLAEFVYLYDSVLPHLVEMIVKLKEDEEYKIKIMNIPDPLYDWMFTLDYVWEILTKRRHLDFNHFRYLEDHKMDFMNKAIEMKVFLPIPPKKLTETPDLVKLWFRNHDVDWSLVHNYLYNKISSDFFMNDI